jgi:hypothetical protein
MKQIRKLLKFALVTQERQNEHGYIRRRLNPYNPLSYIAYVCLLLFAFCIAIKGVIKDLVKDGNFFKWQ